LHKNLKIDLVCLKLRTIDASEFTFSVDQHSATTAHAGAVDHDGVKADDGADLRFPRGIGDSLHHGNRAHRNHQINVCATFDYLAEFVGDEALLTVAAVVGCNHERVADSAHLIFENDKILV